jgi:hypothetical protein
MRAESPRSLGREPPHAHTAIALYYTCRSADGECRTGLSRPAPEAAT